MLLVNEKDLLKGSSILKSLYTRTSDVAPLPPIIVKIPDLTIFDIEGLFKSNQEV